MAKHSKRFTEIRTKVDSGKIYSLDEAVNLVKDTATTKFNETVDLAFKLGVDPRHADQMVRGTVSLPHGTGKSVRVAVFAKGEKAREAEEAGADVVGAEDLAEKIQKGWFEFDVAIAAPDMMSVVGKLGRLLGPKGLMPSPKAGTVTMNIADAVKEFQAGKVEYRVDKIANIHLGIGKTSFEASQLRDNAGAVLESILRARPSAAKGTYLQKVAMSSTMGPGIHLDPVALTNEFSR